jgi:hypothetical protein
MLYSAALKRGRDEKTEAKDKLEEWRKNATKPTCTPEVLVAIIIYAADKPLTRREVEDRVRIFPPVVDVRSALRSMDLGLTERWGKGSPTFETSDDTALCLLRSARILTVPDEVDKAHFNFLALPREIRDQIYELVFTFPKCGVCPDIRSNPKWAVLSMIDTDLNSEQRFSSWISASLAGCIKSSSFVIFITMSICLLPAPHNCLFYSVYTSYRRSVQLSGGPI